MDYKELKDFIKAVAKSGVKEVNIKTDDMKISVKMESDQPEVRHTETVIQQVPMGTQITNPGMMQQPPFQQSGPTETSKKEEEASDDTSNYVEITSPMVGTFYRKPAPDKDTFVNVGDTVNNESIICIVEAMKLFNEIEAETSGKIVKILIDDGTPVEFGQPLMLVDPA
ncbi:MAG: acetyl-CoA carboxylase biotin carboxyl carrier protein [Bacteroidota bacterium]|nr:acetyl-CoA carboxylase biotin carboxyl carrier protein [Bacteroidota bacterium]